MIPTLDLKYPYYISIPKKDQAEQKCAEGNAGPQTLLGETWGINCELK